MYSHSSSSRSSAVNTSTCQIVKIFILQAKLDPAAISQLYTLIDSNMNTIPANGPHFQLCNNPSEADVIISNIHMRKRLERHIDWSLAKQKAIVTPDWLHDSVAQQQMLPWRDYTALDELQEETEKSTSIRSPKQESVLGPSGVEIPSTDPKVFSNHTARYACQRASPLVCPNQKLVVELGVLRMHRDFEGKAANALSYDRAISIKEFVDTGRIEECGMSTSICFPRRTFGLTESLDVIRSDEEFKSLKAFTSIHGVGTSTARYLYSMGLRTLEDMDRYYEVPLTDDGRPLLEGEDLSIYTPNGIRIPKSNKIPELNIKAALTLRQELAEPIPREEIEKMHSIVMSELEGLHPGCSSTIVGGYRRGKHQSNDADIVITHPNLSGGGDKIKNLRKNSIERLYKLGKTWFK
ncbi:hypothetical protein H0H93_007473 [Arthromyces matolae]|nr:hypothetical protein H0H93_007473 [Arthromyces matolae]